MSAKEGRESHTPPLSAKVGKIEFRNAGSMSCIRTWSIFTKALPYLDVDFMHSYRENSFENVFYRSNF